MEYKILMSKINKITDAMTLLHEAMVYLPLQDYSPEKGEEAIESYVQKIKELSKMRSDLEKQLLMKN